MAGDGKRSDVNETLQRMQALVDAAMDRLRATHPEFAAQTMKFGKS
jgi:hypothetical protein